jgi:hypothetical protein
LEVRSLSSREEIEVVLARLEAAPARFAAALSRLEDADAITTSGAGEWSPLEVLAHARTANDIIEPRIFYALVGDSPPLVGYDENTWREVARYITLPITDSLETMRLRRKGLVHALRGIAPDDWDRTGNHEVRGPMTVLEMAQQIAEHEDEHLAQIERATGAWRVR